jgi:hypothetical protein
VFLVVETERRKEGRRRRREGGRIENGLKKKHYC